MAAPPGGAGAHCVALCREVQATLQSADERWRALEARLHEESLTLLAGRFEELREPLGLRDGDLESRAEGSLRHKVRGRVERLVLAPLADRMRQEAGMPVVGRHVASDESDGRHVLDDFFDHWDSEVEPLLRAAGVEDSRLDRKVRRQEAKGIAATPSAVKAEVQQDIIWSNPQGALEVFSRYTRQLAAFLDAQVSEAAVEDLVAELPAVVARAACDWRYCRCVAEFEQLDRWWQGARAALQRRPQLWEQLLQEEGIFVRRVERGIEALSTARLRYASVADFGASIFSFEAGGCRGGGAWPSAQLAPLAEALKDMRTRLRPIRDSAAWRLVNVAKALQWRLAGGGGAEGHREPCPWERAGRQEGARTLAEALISEEAKKGCAASADAADVALVFMQRLDRLMAAMGEVREFLSSQAPAAAAAAALEVLDAALAAGREAGEGLLELLDEPTAAGLEAWRKQWDRIGSSVDGAALAIALADWPWRPESRVPAEERQPRRQRLLTLRGILVFLEEASFRGHLLEPLDCNLGSIAVSAFTAQCLSAVPWDGAQLAQAGGREEPEVDQPPQPAAAAELSPRQGPCDYSPPTRRAPAAAELPTPKAISFAGSRDAGDEARVTEAAPDRPVGSPSASPAASPARPSTVESMSRPVTPSWLMPPWPRPDTPSAGSWGTRPETPSTVCDDAELANMPRVKFVDGQRVSLRPGVTIKGARLPPLPLQRLVLS